MPLSHAEIEFVRDVKPILEHNCVSCHREGNAKGKVRLDTKKAAFAGDDGSRTKSMTRSATNFFIVLSLQFWQLTSFHRGMPNDQQFPIAGTKKPHLLHSLEQAMSRRPL